MKLSGFRSGLVLFAITLLAAPSFGQGFTAEEQKVYDQFLEAQEMDDVREMGQIARKNKDICKVIYRKLEGQMAFSDSIDAWQAIKTLADAMDEADGSNVFGLRTKRVMGMDAETRKLRADLVSQYSGLYVQLKRATESRDVPAIQEASNQMLAVAEKLGKIEEAEFQAYCLAEVANAKKDMDEQLAAVKLYDEIDTILKRAGYQNFTFHGQVVSVRDSLKKQGFDPQAKPGESTGPAGNTGTSWSKDPAGLRYSDPVPLRYVQDEKLQAKFTMPGFSSSENTIVWQRFSLRGDGPAEFASSFQPLGLKLNVSRDGVKIFLEPEGQELREIKVISKPNVVEMEKEFDDMDGKRKKQEYAWLAACGGSEESQFTLSLNAAPQPDAITIRYQPACYLRGEVLDQDIMIFDDNSSGRFGDALGLRDNTSSLNPEFTFSDAMIVGRGKVAGPFTEYLEVDGAFYRLKLSPDDYTVRTRKLDVDIGTVTLNFKGKVQPQAVIIEETREFKGAFFGIGKQPVSVPVGWYRVSYGIIRKGKKAAEDWCQIMPGRTTAFEVKKDENFVVELGEPFTFDFDAEQGGSGDVTIKGASVVVYGKAGELYTRFFDDPVIPEKVSMRVKGGGSAGKPQSMERATIEDYKRDGLSIWQPLDLVMPGKSSHSYEIKMELKKHNLLGGPIKSDWK